MLTVTFNLDDGVTGNEKKYFKWETLSIKENLVPVIFRRKSSSVLNKASYENNLLNYLWYKFGTSYRHNMYKRKKIITECWTPGTHLFQHYNTDICAFISNSAK